MSLREFAEHLGVSKRMVTKWEAGGATLYPGPANQEALDTSLALAGPDVRARFGEILAAPGARPAGGRQVLTHPADGKVMVLVEAGSFLSGPDDRPVWLPAYFIDLFATTNADYRRFVAATGHRPPSHWPRGGFPEALRDHPVVNVSWLDATAYATWAAKALPEDVEWEKAARGPRGARYPWGERPVDLHAVGNVAETGVGTTTPVGRYPAGASPYGAHDMIGNVWEWCATATAPGRRRVIGGAYTTSLADAMPTVDRDAAAGALSHDIGFRCVSPAREALDLLSI
jgi:formylglycine-generating enzyme required for sulfatase activity